MPVLSKLSTQKAASLAFVGFQGADNMGMSMQAGKKNFLGNLLGGGVRSRISKQIRETAKQAVLSVPMNGSKYTPINEVWSTMEKLIDQPLDVSNVKQAIKTDAEWYKKASRVWENIKNLLDAIPNKNSTRLAGQKVREKLFDGAKQAWNNINGKRRLKLMAAEGPNGAQRISEWQKKAAEAPKRTNLPQQLGYPAEQHKFVDLKGLTDLREQDPKKEMKTAIDAVQENLSKELVLFTDEKSNTANDSEKSNGAEDSDGPGRTSCKPDTISDKKPQSQCPAASEAAAEVIWQFCATGPEICKDLKSLTPKVADTSKIADTSKVTDTNSKESWQLSFLSALENPELDKDLAEVEAGLVSAFSEYSKRAAIFTRGNILRYLVLHKTTHSEHMTKKTLGQEKSTTAGTEEGSEAAETENLEKNLKAREENVEEERLEMSGDEKLKKMLEAMRSNSKRHHENYEHVKEKLKADVKKIQELRQVISNSTAKDESSKKRIAADKKQSAADLKKAELYVLEYKIMSVMISNHNNNALNKNREEEEGDDVSKEKKKLLAQDNGATNCIRTLGDTNKTLCKAAAALAQFCEMDKKLREAITFSPAGSLCSTTFGPFHKLVETPGSLDSSQEAVSFEWLLLSEKKDTKSESSNSWNVLKKFQDIFVARKEDHKLKLTAKSDTGKTVTLVEIPSTLELDEHLLALQKCINNMNSANIAPLQRWGFNLPQSQWEDFKKMQSAAKQNIATGKSNLESIELFRILVKQKTKQISTVKSWWEIGKAKLNTWL